MGNPAWTLLVPAMLLLAALLLAGAARRRHGPDGRAGDRHDTSDMPALSGPATARMNHPLGEASAVLLVDDHDEPTWLVEPVAPSDVDETSWMATVGSQQVCDAARRMLAHEPIARLARRGELVRLVNVRAGQLTPSRDGHLLGWVRNDVTGRAATQARLQRWQPPRLASPTLLLTAANVVAGTVWQQQLDRRLDGLDEAVGAVLRRLDARARAEILVGRQRLRELTADAVHAGLLEDLEQDVLLSTARQSATAQLLQVEARLAAAGPGEDPQQPLDYRQVVVLLEGREDLSGLLTELAHATEAVTLTQQVDALRFQLLLASGRVHAAAEVQRAAAELVRRLHQAADAIDHVREQPVTLPLDLRHAVPGVGIPRQQQHRDHLDVLVQTAGTLIGCVRRPAPPVDATELLLHPDGRVQLPARSAAEDGERRHR